MPSKPKSAARKWAKPRPPDPRPSARARGYTTFWQKARRLYLREHPLCVSCFEHGRIVPATVVDHITPHKGDAELFWNQENWQALCKPCHDSKTAREK